MKLLFVINQLYKGGAEQAYINLLNRLDNSKYEIDFVIYDHIASDTRIDLISEIPEWVNVCNVYEGKSPFHKMIRLYHLLRRKLIGRNDYAERAKNFVKDKQYDIAFSCGEWFSPDFLIKYVNAHCKAIWIHNDIATAEYFNGENFFQYDNKIDHYIFVSKHSMENGIEKYPFIKDRSTIIHNIIDDIYVKQRAAEQVEDELFRGLTVVTVGNIRPQKSHLRQVEVMKRLFDKGIRFSWLNIGAMSDGNCLKQVKQKIEQYQLEKNFLLLGPRDNPYKYVRKADIVAVLSDYESWSLVITEAKIIGKPIIATRTSGALEQITANETGILTDFTEEDIARNLEILLTSKQRRDELQKNLIPFIQDSKTIGEFEAFVKLCNRNTAQADPGQTGKTVLYIIDNINYRGGAHNAAKEQIRYLVQQGFKVTVYSDCFPDCQNRIDLSGVWFAAPDTVDSISLINLSTKQCLLSSDYSLQEKIHKFKLWLEKKLLHVDLFAKYAGDLLKNHFENYDIVCVMSEGSGYRKLVSQLKKPKKIQWIHTDYLLWSQFNEYTQALTEGDGTLYKNYNQIVFVSEAGRQGFIKKYPDLAPKTAVVRNLLPIQKVKAMSLEPCKDARPVEKLKIISVGRLEAEKAFERLIRVVHKLTNEGYYLEWTIIGDGCLRKDLEKSVAINHLEKVILFKGYDENPYKYIKNADLFALLSMYEGLPNTVYESLILGTPVMATNVGGIPEQIEDGITGWLVDNDEESIYQGLKKLLNNRQQLLWAREALCSYAFDVEKIQHDILRVFS